MRMSIPNLRLSIGFGLAASLFLGCQNLLDQSGGDTAVAPSSTLDDAALRLAIKDDSVCRREWSAILDARTVGLEDSTFEAGFISECVEEIKPADRMPTGIPPVLLPDSNTRCHWIIAQIEGGRDEMSISYRRYCPDDCRRLEGADSARHDRLCRESGHEPDGDSLGIPGHEPGHDSAIEPPRPRHNPYEDTCRMIGEKLSRTLPGDSGRAELEHLFAGMCKEGLPIDSLPKPPRDSMICPPATRDSLPEHPRDSVKVPPLPWDTIVAPPIPRDSISIDSISHDSICMDLKLRLGASEAGSAARKELEKSYLDYCLEHPDQP